MTGRVIVTKEFVGICHMQVCAVANATDKEILEICNQENPSGTSLGWCNVIREDKETPQKNPVICDKNPKRRHFLINC